MSETGREVLFRAGLFAYPLVVGGAFFFAFGSRLAASEQDVRRLETTALTVARMSTEIEYIKASVSRLEALEGEHHSELLRAIEALQGPRPAAFAPVAVMP